MRRLQPAIAAGLAATLLLGATGDERPRLEEAGWWWRADQGVVETPPPDTVPEDGLLVSNGAGEEANAVAALRYSGAADADTLVLEVAESDDPLEELAAIVACPPAESWERPEGAGEWNSRPEPDCDAGEVNGVRDAAAGTWTWDVSPLLEGGELDVVLIPGGEPEEPEEFEGESLMPQAEQPEGAPLPPFQVVFDPPRDDSLQADPLAAAPDDFATPDPDDDDSAAPDPAEDAMPGAPDAPAETGTGLEAAPPEPETTSSPSGEETPDGDPRAQAPEVAEEAVGARQSPDTTSSPREGHAGLAAATPGFGQDRGRQLAALIALLTAATGAAMMSDRAAATGLLASLSRSRIVRPEVAEKLLGGSATPSGSDGDRPVRGVGRFARPRSGEPPTL